MPALLALALAVPSWALTSQPSATVHRLVRVPAGSLLMQAEKEPKKKGIDLSGLLQVVSMGAGAPMLGDLKKTNFDKPESEGGAALQFELEANNFDLDARGKYFDDGYIEQDGEQGPSFFENLMSGGKLQREYDERMRQGKKK
ncbi:hypothetical protein AB1Y20_015503 [Prymnesium parvum]|uniref:Uncharacterized protein n=1 Tax=Prymnesium parvum TaxID=97485 RepID=A0AB34K1M5_PRYPA